MLRVTIWMNMPSFYQNDLFNALAASGEIDLQVVFARPLTADRLQIGWQDAPRNYEPRMLSQNAPVRNAVRLAWSRRSHLHVINGIWAEPAFAAALSALMAMRTPYAIYTEAPNPYRPRLLWKQAAQTWFGGLAVRHSQGLLPVGQLGQEFCRGLGARAEQIYPFGYFRSTVRGAGQRPAAAKRTSCELIFVGQVIERKGLDLLLEALAAVLPEYSDLSLAIVGDGPWCDALRSRAGSLGIADHVRFEGVIPSTLVPARIAQADLLVLPSRWDGWGMVVNEALMVGVPVLVSDRCGAAELVRHGRNGYLFRGGDVLDLRDRLLEFLGRRESWPGLRAEAARMGERISAEQASRYLIQCLQHMMGDRQERPRPPWVD